MEYFEGFKNLLDKDQEKQVIKLYEDLLKEFGKLNFKHTKYSGCLCHKRMGKGKLKVYLKDTDINKGFCLHFETSLDVGNLGDFKTIDELNHLIKNRMKLSVELITNKDKELN